MMVIAVFLDAEFRFLAEGCVARHVEQFLDVFDAIHAQGLGQGHHVLTMAPDTEAAFARAGNQGVIEFG